MRNDGHSFGVGDPAYSVPERGPAVRYVAWFAFGQVLAKNFIGFAAHTTFDQKTRKVSARNQLGISHKLQCALKCALDTDFGQAVRHFHRTLLASASGGLQALQHGSIVSIKTQANNMNRFACKSHRNLGACQILQPMCLGRSSCPLLPTGFIVICQSP